MPAGERRRLSGRLAPSVVDATFSDVHDAVLQAFFDENEHIAPPALLPYTDEIRAFVATAMVDGEVGNGGWEQLFYNRYDDWLEPAIKGWRLYGSEAHVRLITDVQAVAASGTPARQSAREAGTWDAFAATYETAGLEPFNTRWEALYDEGERLRLLHFRSAPDAYCERP